MAYLYLIEEVPLTDEKSGPWCKIGISKNPPEWRMNANLKRGNPRDLIIRFCYQFDDAKKMRETEKKAHRHFHEYLRTKEWFNISAETAHEWLTQELKLNLRKEGI
jgi:hypothetical protein